MKPVRKAVIFAATISMITDLVEGNHSFSSHELIDCLEILGFDGLEILTLPPILALHKVCTEFAKMEITDDMLKQLSEGEDHE
jgi:hypothetical protein